jgi:hypothetical protein
MMQAIMTRSGASRFSCRSGSRKRKMPMGVSCAANPALRQAGALWTKSGGEAIVPPIRR